jgi:hypothetical protein
MKEINWSNIKTKHPKAWNILIQFKLDKCLLFCEVYNQYELGIDESECGYQEMRDLYDFFDSFDIYISTHKEDIGSDEWEFSYEIEYLPKEHENAKRRCAHFEIIRSYSEYGATYTGAYTTRVWAEIEAFEKGFEILEKLLDNE